jgi:tryptophan synthase beta chain
MTPLMPMYTLGHAFIPPAIHAGGLRYHGMAPLVSHLVKERHVEATALRQLEVFGAARIFSRTEGIVPAPESAHAIAAAINEAKRSDLEGIPRTILFNLSGHGYFDMAAYDAFLEGRLADTDLPEDHRSEVVQTIEG